jgi:hypothetical protein
MNSFIKQFVWYHSYPKWSIVLFNSFPFCYNSIKSVQFHTIKLYHNNCSRTFFEMLGKTSQEVHVRDTVI